MSQFEAAGKELLEWCGDARAYTPHFESNLMQCLHVVNNVTRTGAVGPDLGNLRITIYICYFTPTSLYHRLLLPLSVTDLFLVADRYGIVPLTFTKLHFKRTSLFDLKSCRFICQIGLCSR